MQEQTIKSTKERRATLSERDTVAINSPQHAQHTGNHEGLHEYGEHVFGANHATIEQTQTGNTHEKHQYGCHNHPGSIALVRDGCWSSCGSCSCIRSGGSCCWSSGRCSCIVSERHTSEAERTQQHQSGEKAFHSVLLIAHPRRIRRYGYGELVRDRKQKPCRRRFCRCWPIFRWLR